MTTTTMTGGGAGSDTVRTSARRQPGPELVTFRAHVDIVGAFSMVAPLSERLRSV